MCARAFVYECVRAHVCTSENNIITGNGIHTYVHPYVRIRK